jgi:hypothetical protein
MLCSCNACAAPVAHLHSCNGEVDASLVGLLLHCGLHILLICTATQQHPLKRLCQLQTSCRVVNAVSCVSGMGYQQCFCASLDPVSQRPAAASVDVSCCVLGLDTLLTDLK